MQTPEPNVALSRETFSRLHRSSATKTPEPNVALSCEAPPDSSRHTIMCRSWHLGLLVFFLSDCAFDFADGRNLRREHDFGNARAGEGVWVEGVGEGEGMGEGEAYTRVRVRVI